MRLKLNLWRTSEQSLRRRPTDSEGCQTVAGCSPLRQPGGYQVIVALRATNINSCLQLKLATGGKVPQNVACKVASAREGTSMSYGGVDLAWAGVSPQLTTSASGQLPRDQHAEQGLS
ncbi:hypothetical protein AB1N83_002113 [Pleurotus pulmonarius]